MKKFIISGCYLGYSPIAPGSVGALWGVALYVFLLSKLNPYIYLLILIGLIILGIWLTSYGELIFGIKDSPCIVFDEIVGFLIAAFMIKPTFYKMILVYFMARLFDTIKPPPVRRLSNLKKGYGVMLDDVLSSIYACITCHILLFLISLF
jgi:phosphatidylglycerophosphatase A